MAVVALDGELGCPHVVLLGLQNETDLVEGSCHGEVIDHAHGKLYVGVVLIGASGLSLVEHHLVVALGKDKVGVAARDDGGSLVFTRMTDNLDVEFLDDALLQLDVNVGILDVALALLQSFGGEVFEHFELIFGLADKGTQGYSDGQADHSGAGNAHAHGILEHIGAEQHLDTVGTLAQQSGCLGRTQRHSHRFGAADGGNYFLIDKSDDALAGLHFLHDILYFWGKGTKIIQKRIKVMIKKITQLP